MTESPGPTEWGAGPGVGPWQGPLPTGADAARYDPELLRAGDTRNVVDAYRYWTREAIIADIDRMGALALHVAKIARRRHPQHALPEEVNGYFAEMGRVAVELAHSAREVLDTLDPEKARQIRDEDDAMDDLHRHLFSVLMDKDWKHGVTAAVDVTLLSRFYERFADHAVEISRRVIFTATGELPDDNLAEPQ